MLKLRDAFSYTCSHGLEKSVWARTSRLQHKHQCCTAFRIKLEKHHSVQVWNLDNRNACGGILVTHFVVFWFPPWFDFEIQHSENVTLWMLIDNKPHCFDGTYLASWKLLTRQLKIWMTELILEMVLLIVGVSVRPAVGAHAVDAISLFLSYSLPGLCE